MDHNEIIFDLLQIIYKILKEHAPDGNYFNAFIDYRKDEVYIHFNNAYWELPEEQKIDGFKRIKTPD